ALQEHRSWPPPPDHALQIPAHVKIDRWQTEHRTADVTTPTAAFAVLALTDYPAWRVRRNGTDVKNVVRTGGVMAVPIQPGPNHIEVTWRTTRDQGAGIVLSLCGVAVTLALSWSERRRKEVPVP
ncbi:MAG TPA: hypothetical protein VJV22_02250, partial [Acidobacteriaceae bacterium]|nr:hypothetical protein [Acidobacteriaceae bacterium]